jgi:hypothetical protein
MKDWTIGLFYCIGPHFEHSRSHLYSVEDLNFEIDQFIAMQKWMAILGSFFGQKFYKNTATTFSHRTTSKYILPHDFNPLDLSAVHFNLHPPHLSPFPHHKRTNMAPTEN